MLDPMTPGPSPLEVAVCQAPRLLRLHVSSRLPSKAVAYMARFNFIAPLDSCRITADHREIAGRAYHDLVRDLSSKQIVGLCLPQGLSAIIFLAV